MGKNSILTFLTHYTHTNVPALFGAIQPFTHSSTSPLFSPLHFSNFFHCFLKKITICSLFLALMNIYEIVIGRKIRRKTQHFKKV